MDTTFLKEKIDATKLQITAYEEAFLVLSEGAQSYTLDTGQTRQTVTKLDLSSLNNTIDSLYNRCAMLEARLYGSGSVTVRPNW